MTEHNDATPPRPGMRWSEKHQMWIDADTRSPRRRQLDEEIVRDLEADRDRIDAILRNVREIGEPTAVEEAATEVARRLLQALVEARLRAGFSQTEVARRMGVPQSAIARLEAGTHSPTLSTLARYTSAIGAGLDVRQPA